MGWLVCRCIMGLLFWCQCISSLSVSWTYAAAVAASNEVATRLLKIILECEAGELIGELPLSNERNLDPGGWEPTLKKARRAVVSLRPAQRDWGSNDAAKKPGSAHVT